jgi:hypothetical protein
MAKVGNFGDEPQRPKEMHGRTFQRLADVAAAAYLASFNTAGWVGLWRRLVASGPRQSGRLTLVRRLLELSIATLLGDAY